jgi:hypothetical protein
MAGAFNHRKVSAVADGADTSLVRPSDWNDTLVLSGGASGQQPVRDASQTDGWQLVDYLPGSFTNSTGGSLAAGDVVTIDQSGNVELDDTQSSLRQFVVAKATIGDGSAGLFARSGLVTGVKATGTINALEYIRKSATSKSVETTGVACASDTPLPRGAIGYATANASGGTVSAYLFGFTVSGVTIVASTVSVTDIVNDASEQAIYSVSIPAYLVGAGRKLRVALTGDYNTNTGSDRTVTVKTKLGATVLFSHSYGATPSSVNSRVWRHMVELVGTSTTSQVAFVDTMLGAAGSAAAAGGSPDSPLGRYAGSAISGCTVDMSAAATFAITVQHSVASASLSIRATHVFAEML